MNSEITAYLSWTICFFIMVINRNKTTGILSIKEFKIHYIISWILLMINVSAFNMLSWAISNPKGIKESFFVECLGIPAWLNLTSWIINLLLGIVIIALVFMLIRQSLNAKKWILKIMPFWFVFIVLEGVKNFYKTEELANEPIFSVLLYFVTIYLIPLTAVFYFYTNKKFVEVVFGIESKKEKLENVD